MAGRFAKHNGATLVIEREAPKSKSTDLRRFKPDFYDPIRKPIKSPNLLQKRANGTFGKRIVDAAAKQVARRAPLALAGPLGDLLALGLITWEMYLLLLELQNNANPVHTTAAAPGGTGDPSNYDWTGWNVAVTPGTHPYGSTQGFPTLTIPGATANPVGSPYVVNQNRWFDVLDGINPNNGYQVGIGTTLENWLSTHPNAGQGFRYQNDYDTDLVGPPAQTIQGHAWYGWYQRISFGSEPLYIGVGTPLPDSLPLDWAEPDPNMKRDFFPDGKNMANQAERAPQEDPSYKRGPRIRPPRPSRPDRNVRERKAKGSLQTVLKILDIVSEGSELVGAFYDALPKDTRQKWEADYAGGHFAEVDGKWKWIIDSRGLLDNAGQYGIDGADWKARALWHNWHKVDIEQAIKNVIANEFQDKILGMYQRSLPKNIGHAADAGSMGLNDLINLFNDTIGLS